MKKEFLVERQGKSLVLYAGLLDEAHNQGLKAIRTRLLQIPNAENGNVAICAAEVETERGVFAGLGDAAPENVSRRMMPHLIRMAETRSKARALRDAINVAVCAVEELAELDEGDLAPSARSESDREHVATPRRQEARDSRGSGEGAPEAARKATPRAAGERAVGAASGTAAAGLAEAGHKATPKPDGATMAGAASGSVAAGPDRATAAQVRAIYSIARDHLGMADAQAEERCKNSYRCLPAELSKKQASEFIDYLKR